MAPARNPTYPSAAPALAGIGIGMAESPN